MALFIRIAVTALVAGASLAAGDVDDLRAAHEKRITSINSGETDFAAEQQHVLGVAFSPGSPFASHDPNRTTESMKAEWRAQIEPFEWRKFQLINPQYLVIGSTGVVWGHVRATHKLIDGPQQIEHRKTTHVYVNEGGAWKLLVTHTSWMPDGALR